MSHQRSTDTTPDAEQTLLQLRGLVAALSPSRALDAEMRDALALLLEELVERLEWCLRARTNERQYH